MRLKTFFAGCLAMLLPSTLQAAVVYEPFADSNASLNGNTPGAGLTGTWSASSTGFAVGAGSLSYGTLATSGNQVTYSGSNAQASVTTGTDLADAGLLADNSSLWFSALVHTPDTGGSNPDTAFAFGTASLTGSNNIPMNSTGSGLGWAIKNNKLQAADWSGGNRALGTGISVANSTTYLVVGRFDWGASSDTLTLYMPDTNLNQGAAIGSITSAANLDQTTFDTISTGLKTNTGYGFDEIRFGASYGDVVPTATPEPASIAFLGVAGLLFLRRQRAN